MARPVSRGSPQAPSVWLSAGGVYMVADARPRGLGLPAERSADRTVSRADGPLGPEAWPGRRSPACGNTAGRRLPGAGRGRRRERRAAGRSGRQPTGEDSLVFQSFFLAGFECATGYNRHGEWIDQVAATHHDLCAQEDYRLLSEVGIFGARESIRWPLVD